MIYRFNENNDSDFDVEVPIVAYLGVFSHDQTPLMAMRLEDRMK